MPRPGCEQNGNWGIWFARSPWPHCPIVMLPLTTGPLRQEQQWIMIAENCGPSLKFQNLIGGIIVNPGFWHRTLLQGGSPRSFRSKGSTLPRCNPKNKMDERVTARTAAGYPARNSGYCCNIGDLLLESFGINGRKWEERALFRSFSATRQPARRGGANWKRVAGCERLGPLPSARAVLRLLPAAFRSRRGGVGQG